MQVREKPYGHPGPEQAGIGGEGRRLHARQTPALASGSGFSKELEEWTEDRGEPWLVGLEKIFGLESPDELWPDKK